jgi:hypothetical protein
MIYAWADVVESRDETFFKALTQLNDGGSGGFSQGMYNAIFCLDGSRDAMIASGAADREEFPILSTALGTAESNAAAAQLCRDLGMYPRGSAEYAPVSTDIPALIVSGDMDPITPPPLAEAIMPGFSNGTLVVFPYTGHGPLRSLECGGDMLNSFFDDPMGELDLSCVDEVEAPDFFVPLYETRIATRLGLIAVEDKKKLAGPVIWGGFSVTVSLFAFFILSLGSLGRRIDRRQPVDMPHARLATWLAASFSTLAIVVIGAAAGVTADASEILLLFGMVPWAWYGAVAGVFAGLAGIAAIGLTIRIRLQRSVPIGTLVGFLMTGLAAFGLSSFLLYWDLRPF